MTSPRASGATRPAAAPAVATIQRRVAARYGVRANDLRSARRAVAVAWPRHVAMHLARELTMHSLPAIGRLFGGRDHSSVMYALRRVKDRMACDQFEATVIRSLVHEISADLPWAKAAGTNGGRLDRLAALLERRTALKGDRDHLDREIAEIDFEIEQLGREAWGAEGVAPEAREEQAPEAGEEQAPEPVAPEAREDQAPAPVTLPVPVAATPAAPPARRRRARQ